MTKQEEIKEGIIVNIVKACPDMLNSDILKLTDIILKGEDSQGVVIKVDCPECDGDGRTLKFLDGTFSNRCYKCNGYGFKAVEPLIKEK